AWPGTSTARPAETTSGQATDRRRRWATGTDRRRSGSDTRWRDSDETGSCRLLLPVGVTAPNAQNRRHGTRGVGRGVGNFVAFTSASDRTVVGSAAASGW